MKKDFRGEIWYNVNKGILAAMYDANSEPVDGGYGKDSHSLKAEQLMQKNFKDKIWATFAISGTAANVMALKSMLGRADTVLCAAQTHINCYECGATEYTLGNKIVSIDSPDGKMTVELLKKLMLGTKKYKYCHKVVAITQPTEFGTVYTVNELKELTDYVHSLGMYVYLDGARIGNAADALGAGLAEMIEYPGIDAFSFGGTKAGGMFGEMVVFRRKEFAANLEYMQKQSLQHMSKSKFLGVQLEYILKNGLWLKNAHIANERAKYLQLKLEEKGIKPFYEVQSNMVFAVLTDSQLERVTEVYDLHYWNEFDKTVRIAVTHETTMQAIDELVSLI